LKKLILLRHAAAETSDIESGDLGRKLTEKGRKKAVRMASKLTSSQIKPDVIISSPAARALETAEIFAETIGFPVGEILQEKTVYNSIDARDFFRFFDGFDDNIKTVLLVGHNPTLSEFGWYLCPHFRGSLKKTAILGIGFENTAWSAILPGRGKLLFYKAGEKDD